MVRSTLRRFLETEPDLVSVGEAHDGEEAIMSVHPRHVDVLLDLSMPVPVGIGALPRIRASSPHTRIVVVSAYAAASYAQGIIDAGAVAYLEKVCEPEAIVDAMREAMQRPGAANDPHPGPD